MNDDGFDFELEPYKDGPEHGVRGTVGPFGRARIFHTIGKWKSGDVFRADLTGDGLPATHLTSRGVGGEPSITNSATLDVGGIAAELRYNMLGISRAQRALRIKLSGRTYTYTKTTASGGAALRRDGVLVALANGRRSHGPGSLRMRNATVRGPVDATDLAVALIFEATGVSSLSVGSALVSAPFKAVFMTPGE